MNDKTSIDTVQNAARLSTHSGTAAGVFAFCVGLIVLPLYSPQPLATVLGPELGLAGDAAGVFPMLSLAGYAIGLLLLVPLADIVENRRLVCTVLFSGSVALALAASARGAALFAAMVFASGTCCSSIQILVPIAAQRVSGAERGRMIGTVMSGLMFGILCSRPFASMTAQHFGWRTVYALYAILFATCAVALRTLLPRRTPADTSSYGRLLRSMCDLVRSEPVLRRRALSQALCMVAFSLFWTAVPFRLHEAPFALGGDGIGLFALAGAAGVVIAPIAGRIGDRGRTVAGTRAAHLAIIVAAAVAALSGLHAAWPQAYPALALTAMAIAAFVLDLGVIGDQTLGRRLVNLLNPATSGRLNGLYTGLFFIGGALGAVLSGPCYARFGWAGICAGCATAAAVALWLSYWSTPCGGAWRDAPEVT